MSQAKCPICEDCHEAHCVRLIGRSSPGPSTSSGSACTSSSSWSGGNPLHRSRRGASHPAFAPTPIDISAADLYDQVEDTIQDVAGDIGLWGGKAPQLLAKLAARMGRLADAPNSGRDYKCLTNALHRVKLRTTPPQDRIIHGHCLNPSAEPSSSA